MSVVACAEKPYLSDFSDQQLVDVLIDVHVANALIEKQTLANKDSLKEEYTLQIIAMNQITRADFDSIISVVHLDINRYKTISSAVEDSLSSLKTKLEKERRAKKNR